MRCEPVTFGQAAFTYRTDIEAIERHSY